MNIAKKAGKAGMLMLLKKTWGALISFLVLAYLARTLTQEDFGIVAISATLISFIQVIAMSGISEFIIFYNGNNKKEINNAAFWLNLLLTTIISLILFFIAPFWSDFYNDSRITSIIYLLIINFFFNMLAAIPKGIFRKEINYKPMIAVQTIFGTIANILKVLFAYLGFGVYSLALPGAIIAPLIVITLFWKSGFVPKKYFGITYWKQIFNYTKFIIGQRVFNKLINEGDSLIIGKFFGMQILGVYNLAFQFATIFTSHFLPLISNISIPVLSKNNQDVNFVSTHYYKMMRLVAFISIPIITILILNAELLITTIYGKKWINSILIFQILSIAIIFKSISSPTSGLIYVMGKPKIGFYFTASFSVVFIFFLFISTFFNNIIITVGIITFVRVIGSFFIIYFSLKLIYKKIHFLFGLVAPILLPSFVFIIVKLFFSFSNFLSGIVISFVYIIILSLINILYNKKNLVIFFKDVKKLNPI